MGFGESLCPPWQERFYTPSWSRFYLTSICSKKTAPVEPNRNKMEKIYTQLHSYGDTYTVPIAKLDDAIKTKTCYPAPLDDPKEIAERAKTSIYRIITTSIPESNITMQNIVSPYHTNQDGYELLYVLSCMVLPFMLHGKNGWGPQEWDIPSP